MTSFDTLAAAEALEAAGMDRGIARACAAQMQAAASAGEPVTRPELDAALAALKADLLERIAETDNRIAGVENRMIERIVESENRTIERIAETERRLTMLVWRLFGGAVAVAGLAVAALKYLP